MAYNGFPRVLDVLHSKALFGSLKYSYILLFHSITCFSYVSHEWKLYLNQNTSSKMWVENFIKHQISEGF